MIVCDARFLNYDSQGLIEPEVQVAFDTVPIYMDDVLEHTFNPKYEDNVAKLFVAVSLTGFIVSISSTLYSGTTGDSYAQRHSQIEQKLRQFHVKALADGAFVSSDVVTKPHSGPQIHPKRLKPGQTVEQYKVEANAKKSKNEQIGFFRSRVEHMFCRSLFGRFLMFKNYSQHTGNLWNFVQCACIGLNMELNLLNPNQRTRYGKYSDEEVQNIRKRFEEHPLANKRYPEKTPLPPLKRKRGAENEEEEPDSEQELHQTKITDFMFR